MHPECANIVQIPPSWWYVGSNILIFKAVSRDLSLQQKSMSMLEIKLGLGYTCGIVDKIINYSPNCLQGTLHLTLSLQSNVCLSIFLKNIYVD